ncbi:hypothetical protein [Arthrobacter sp. JCM 19049]|uniref:hypothetical protein n=1 Tax=Arthrobacter sp. JCM 19049 TaxID=1460643 RepID=UPI000A729263|nr:hypothetical protein [Arthrobacter sp. JCM 19049]
MEILIWLVVVIFVLVAGFFWLQSVRKRNMEQISQSVSREAAQAAAAKLDEESRKSIYRDLAKGDVMAAVQKYRAKTGASVKECVIAVRSLDAYPQAGGPASIPELDAEPHQDSSDLPRRRATWPWLKPPRMEATRTQTPKTCRVRRNPPLICRVMTPGRASRCRALRIPGTSSRCPMMKLGWCPPNGTKNLDRIAPPVPLISSWPTRWMANSMSSPARSCRRTSTTSSSRCCATAIRPGQPRSCTSTPCFRWRIWSV